MPQVCKFAGRSLLLLAAVVVLCFCGSGFAQDQDAGKTFSVAVTVIDDKNQPVPDASVEVHSGDKSLGASPTDSSGKVTLSLPSAGDYSLTISKKGYLNTGTTVAVSAENPVQEMDVVMSGAALSQQSVTVTGEASSPVTESESGQKTLSLAQAKISARR